MEQNFGAWSEEDWDEYDAEDQRMYDAEQKKYYRNKMTIDNLKNYLTWLVTPQDDNEAKIFKENDLIDTHIQIVNKLDSMSKQELIDEINHQLEPYKLKIDQIK